MARVAVLALLALAACGPDSVFGPPTESTCPQGSTLTYENFGKGFMTQYCTRCHSSELVGVDRHGAPSFHDFDTLFGIKAVADHVDETTASGPASTNTGMPPDGPFPTLEERKQLGEWIACGMPSDGSQNAR
ncbi:MAG: cytochrome c [Kofleriaceae bacterium]|nr:cytochrome c [Kofleriaceae bacterium]